MKDNFHITATSRCRILVVGGQEIFHGGFAEGAKWSCMNEVSLYRLWSRAHLRALEALGFHIAKYAFSLFLGILSSKF